MSEATLAPTVAPRPWRTDSLFWVAFFGGPLAVAGIAFLNARRHDDLDLAKHILFLGAFAYAASIIVYLVGLAAAAPRWSERPTQFAIALVFFLVARRSMLRTEERYVAAHGDGFSSLWISGVLAVLGFGAISVAIKSGLASVLGL